MSARSNAFTDIIQFISEKLILNFGFIIRGPLVIALLFLASIVIGFIAIGIIIISVTLYCFIFRKSEHMQGVKSFILFLVFLGILLTTISAFTTEGPFGDTSIYRYTHKNQIAKEKTEQERKDKEDRENTLQWHMKRVSKTFKGSYYYAYNPDACIQNCEGHEAGYQWAIEHDIMNTNQCGGKSESFIDGCRAFIQEVNYWQDQALQSYNDLKRPSPEDRY